MDHFTIHTRGTAPDGSRDALAALEQNIGFIPNLAATIADAPVAMASFVAQQSALRGSTLTAQEREVVGLTVSAHNRCRYSLAAHATFALGAGATPAVVSALRAGDPVPDGRLEALHAFTQAVLDRRGHVAAGDVDALIDAGFTREQLLEALTQLAYTTLANLVANVADTPVDAAFAPQDRAAATA
jgi:uncharacterized peroxidase-related enzyme